MTTREVRHEVTAVALVDGVFHLNAPATIEIALFGVFFCSTGLLTPYRRHIVGISVCIWNVSRLTLSPWDYP